MPFLLFALPALVVQVSPAPPSMDQLQELLKAIPMALVEGKGGGMRGQVVKVNAAWDQAKPEIRKTMPEPEISFIDRQLKAMQKMKPREQALGALGISSTLSRFQGKSRKQDLLQAERLVLAAWCGADGGQWEPFPNVAEGFKPILQQDNGAHALAVVAVQDGLKRLQESLQKRQTVAAKKALKDLLAATEVIAKS